MPHLRSMPQDEASQAGLVLVQSGAVRAGQERAYPLNKLKASPDNVRKSGHGAAAVEARAASILANGLIQPPVVRPERRADGGETGYALVTAGEGRRLALRLLAKRKIIPKTVLVRCLVDEANIAAEVSLAENHAREPLSPADEFEAFRALAQDQGWGAEAIAARFGVTPAVVRQRLRLAAVAPDLIDLHRQGELTLDQLMAFAVSEDHERQRQVMEAYPGAHPSSIRRAMTEATVAAQDRRAIFIGVEAYVAAGGSVIRDLFTDDRGGYLSDVALVDAMVSEKLLAVAERLRDQEGWKWAQARLDYPHGHGLRRVWPHRVEPSPDQLQALANLRAAYEALSEQWAQVEDPPPQIEARLADLEEALNPEPEEAYAPDVLARAGIFVVLDHDGRARIERGFVRPQDEAPAPDAEDGAGEAGDEAAGGDDDGQGRNEGDGRSFADPGAGGEDDEPAGEASAPLSVRLVAELTAHRTAGLRLALSQGPDLALVALTHVLALRTFFSGGAWSCLEITAASTDLVQYGEGVKTSPAHAALEARFDQWARQMPKAANEVWDFVVGLDVDSRQSLIAFCVARTLNAVRAFNGRRAGLDHAEALAAATALDMRAVWTPTAERFLDRVTKAHVLAAVAEAVSPDTAQRLSGLKKAELVAAAEPDLVAARWLPALLRTRGLPQDAEPNTEAAAGAVQASQQPVDPAGSLSPQGAQDQTPPPGDGDLGAMSSQDDSVAAAQAGGDDVELDPERVAAE